MKYKSRPKIRCTSERHYLPLNLLGLRNNSLVLPTRYIIQRPLEMLFRGFQARALLVCLQIRVYELNQAVQVLCRHL